NQIVTLDCNSSKIHRLSISQKGKQVHFSPILKRFMEKSPIPVMVQALLERVLSPEQLNAVFDRAVDKQYTRELLFSSLFDLMSLTVTKVFPTVNAAYQSSEVDIGVSLTSVYNKLNGLEPEVAATLIRDTAIEFKEIAKSLQGENKAWLPGYKIKVLDGNCIEATEHRLKVLRNTASAALPGKLLVIYTPENDIATDVIPCEDGHAQERSLLAQVREKINKNDVFIMDRNFCVLSHLSGIADQSAYFICRLHQQLPYETLGEPVIVGDSETGQIAEEWITIKGDQYKKRKWRLITVYLKKATRDGDKKISIITNLPESAAKASVVAIFYQKRWSIETMFQRLESYLHSEINTLAYPKAALFGFSVAVIAYNVLAVVKAALISVHGVDKIENEVSGYYIAGEISRTYEGMNVAVPPEDWTVFQSMSEQEFILILYKLAENVVLKKYKKHKRGPKKVKEKPKQIKIQPHISTARLLKAAKKSP
ncbi:IS4 family transposase, partial [Spartinivicinus poritis]